MVAKTGFMSPLRYLCSSGGNEVVKSSIESKRQKRVLTIDKPPRSLQKPSLSHSDLKLTAELRKQILAFRTAIDLQPVKGSASTPELLTKTVDDLYKAYPEIIPKLQISDIGRASTKQGLAYFWNALVSIGDSWTKNTEWRAQLENAPRGDNEKINTDKLIGEVLTTLDCIIKLKKAKSDIMDAEENEWEGSGAIDIVTKKKSKQTSSCENSGGSSPFSPNSGCCSPISPTSVLPELPKMSNLDQYGDFAKQSYKLPHIVPFRLQPVGKLAQTEVKHLSLHNPSYLLHSQQKRTAEEPPAEKKVKLDSKVAVQGDCKHQGKTQAEIVCSTEDEIHGEVGSLLGLAPQPPEQLPEKGTSPPELSAEVPATPLIRLQSTSGLVHVLAQKIASLPPSEHPSTGSTLPVLPPPEFPNVSESQPSAPSPQTNLSGSPRVPLPPPPPTAPSKVSSTLSVSQPPPPPTPPRNVSGNLNGPPPPPPPPPMIPFILKGPLPPPPPPMVPNYPKGPSPPTPPLIPSNLKGPPPPPPPMGPKGSIPLPPMGSKSGAAGPPPPPPGGRTLGPKATTKLKRSSQMGNLYRLLKGKVEGSSLNGKSVQGRKSLGSGTSGKQGMADALAEITKRSAYFQQIEADVEKYAKTITEMKSTITTFQTKDMAELVKFHQHVESHLENLTDESQVLARFEGFPTKKLECLRIAAALYSKLDSMHKTILNWKITPPLSQLLVKVDAYFTKIKGEVDALERTKDEELKRFKSHNIHFDFNILIKIKESMVDLSSGCMELALQESREAKAVKDGLNSPKGANQLGSAKLLWKAFQFAFRVYTFAGGQDDRADRLTRELAHEIETEPEL